MGAGERGRADGAGRDHHEAVYGAVGVKALYEGVLFSEQDAALTDHHCISWSRLSEGVERRSEGRTEQLPWKVFDHLALTTTKKVGGGQRYKDQREFHEAPPQGAIPG